MRNKLTDWLKSCLIMIWYVFLSFFEQSVYIFYTYMTDTPIYIYNAYIEYIWSHFIINLCMQWYGFGSSIKYISLAPLDRFIQLDKADLHVCVCGFVYKIYGGGQRIRFLVLLCIISFMLKCNATKKKVGKVRWDNKWRGVTMAKYTIVYTYFD